MDTRFDSGLPLRQPYHHGRPSRLPLDRGGGRHSHDASASYANGVRSRHNSHSRRDKPSRRSLGNATLEAGIEELSHCVDAAIDEFSNFEQEFRQDIHRIRNYCDSNLIEAVWMQKVHPREQSRNHQHGRSAEAEGPDSSERRPPGLRDTIKTVLSGLGAALNAAEQFRPSQRRPSRYAPEDIPKIHKRLQRAVQDLRELFPEAMERHEELKNMKTALGELRLFLTDNGAEPRGDGGGNVRFDDTSGRAHGGRSEDQHQDAYGDDDEHVEEYTGGGGNGGGKPAKPIRFLLLTVCNQRMAE
ncbi:MAG: hypothetical protein Q9218_003015 [Villophora microphyllina]